MLITIGAILNRSRKERNFLKNNLKRETLKSESKNFNNTIPNQNKRKKKNKRFKNN